MTHTFPAASRLFGSTNGAVSFDGSGFGHTLQLRTQAFPYLLASDHHPEVISSVPMHVEICNVRFAPRLALACRCLHMFSVVLPEDGESECERVNGNRSFYSGDASLAQW